jgi:hypothetical protein
VTEEEKQMHVRGTAAFLAGLVISAVSGGALAHGDGLREGGFTMRWKGHGLGCDRIATLVNYRNNAPGDLGEETVSEIVAATADGRTLVYTDSPLEQVGLIDISNPAEPTPEGKLDVGGEPTSVDVLGNRCALVAVNTSESFTNPSGKLVVVDLYTHSLGSWKPCRRTHHGRASRRSPLPPMAPTS